MQLNDLQQQRLAKLERLRAAGIEPYPPRAERSHTIAAVLEAFDEIAERAECVTLAGRIVGARRIMGKLAFAHIEDGTGKIQLWISKADLGDEWFARFRDDLDTFDIVQVAGTLRRTTTGEPSLFVERMVVSGFEKDYEICKDFRNEGVDRTHLPEFTMMECYQAYADYNDMMELVEELFRYVAREVCGTTVISYRGQTIDFGPNWERVSILVDDAAPT